MVGKELVPTRALPATTGRRRAIEAIATRLPSPTRYVPAIRGVGARIWHWVSPRPIDDYLRCEEECLARTGMHVIVPIRSAVQGLVGLPVSIALGAVLGMVAPGVWWLQALLWVAAISHPGYMTYLVLLWRADRLVVTDERIVRVSGLFTAHVEAQPLFRVTGYEYTQTFLGRLLDYGTFRIETGGRHDEGALRELVPYVPHPRRVWLAIGGDGA